MASNVTSVGCSLACIGRPRPTVTIWFGHRNLDIQVVPFADHSFTDWTFKERIKIEETIVEWILERLAELPSAAPPTSTTQER